MTPEAQRERVRTAREESNTPALSAERLIPQPSCACSSKPTAAYRIKVRFWGVRGSTPTPTAANLGYGGNTTCIEITSRNQSKIIIDAGTGALNLGRVLMDESPSQALHCHLFLTHFHWDHIQGIPFFAPLLSAGNKVTFYSAPPANEIRRRLEQQMSSPFFTLSFASTAATRDFCQLENTLRLGDLSVTPFPLNHPQGACGYRVECEGTSVIIATDLEHGDATLDRVLVDRAQGADLLVYDAQYTPAEYQTRKGWGHSTYEAAAHFARQAAVKKLVLFHHDPLHDDSAVDDTVQNASRHFENVIGAREQCTITL